MWNKKTIKNKQKKETQTSNTDRGKVLLYPAAPESPKTPESTCFLPWRTCGEHPCPAAAVKKGDSDQEKVGREQTITFPCEGLSPESSLLWHCYHITADSPQGAEVPVVSNPLSELAQTTR